MMLQVLILIDLAVALTSAVWVEPSSPLLPETNWNMAVGYYSGTNSIFLIGGQKTSSEFVNYVTQYDITTNLYTQHTEINVGSFAMQGQSYTTIDDTVYMWECISQDDLEQHAYITTFNMPTMQYSTSAIEKPASDNLMFGVCLTQVDDRYLIALGGSPRAWTYSDRFRIYDTLANAWLDDGPSMLRVVHTMACAVATDSNGDTWLYVMGGQDPYTSEGNGHLWDVDRIKVTDMNNLVSNGGWNRLSDHLSFGVYGNRAAAVGDKIYAMSGWKGNDPRTPGSMVVVPAVDIIDVNTNTITSTDDLVTAVSSPGVIVAQDYARIYVFGGQMNPTTSISNKMQYLQYDTTTTSTTTTTTTTSTTTTATSTETLIETTSSSTASTSCGIWVEPSSPLLSDGIWTMAVGYYSATNSIFLIGGRTESGYVNYVTHYDLTTNQYTQHTEINVGSFDMRGQSYTTIDDTIYMWESIQTGGIEQHPYITTFNMATMQYSTSAIEKPASDNFMFGVCLTQVDDRYLIALGGSPEAWTYSDRFRIYDIVENIWLDDGPSLLRAVHTMACAVATDSNGDKWLYVMGGQDPYTSEGNGHLWDVDRIKVTDLNNLASDGGWDRLSDHLSYGVYGNRAAVLDNKIYALSGWKGNDPRTPGSLVYVPAVDIIDVDTNTISSSDDLVTAVNSPGIIAVDDYARIYVFGGRMNPYTSIAISNKIQYLQCETTTTTSPTTTATSSTLSFSSSSTSFTIAAPHTQKEPPLVIWLIIVICIILLICIGGMVWLLWKRNHKTNDDGEYKKSNLKAAQVEGVIIATPDDGSSGSPSADNDLKGELPSQWKVAYTTDGKRYYQNDITKKTRWNMPAQTVINIGETNNGGVSAPNDKVRHWIENAVGFPQYVDCFIANGYDSFEVIMDITDKADLIDIGITLKGHQNRIMRQIEMLKDGRCDTQITPNHPNVATAPEVSALTQRTESNATATWKYKKMRKWNNGEVFDWAITVNLGNQMNNKVLDEIRNGQCVGKDIRSLTSVQHVRDAFGIENNDTLCKDILSEIFSFKPEIKANEAVYDAQDDRFKINVFSQQKHLVLNEQITKNETVQYIKVLYKIQSGVTANIDDIHFYCKNKLLQTDHTLEQVGIVNDQHLITVKFGTDGVD